MNLSNIERHINTIIETDFTVDSIASDLCPDGFYRVTRFKAREHIIGKYEPYQITKELFNQLNSIPYTYCFGKSLQLYTLQDDNGNQEITIFGDLSQLQYSDVVFESDITLLGLYCLSHKVWKKEWKLPKLNVSNRARTQLLNWLFTTQTQRSGCSF